VELSYCIELNGLFESSLGLYSWYNNSWHPIGGVVDSVNNTITVSSVNHFSDWTAGEYDSGGLPIELLTFDAEYNGATVDLSWSTATETNNDFFTIERSKDARNYEIVGTVLGAGNSNSILTYKSNDDKSLSGTVYYRLKQTDYDGQFEYFPPVAVSVTSVQTEMNVSMVGPNPFNSEFFVEFNSGNLEPVGVYLYNVRGQLVFKDSYIPSEGENRYTYKDNNNLPPGYYVVSLQQNNVYTKGVKLLKK